MEKDYSPKTAMEVGIARGNLEEALKAQYLYNCFGECVAYNGGQPTLKVKLLLRKLSDLLS